nr:hypothetical protein [Pseudoxanthomonas yeongjuensis]
MILQVGFIHDHVFPETTLPDAALAFGDADIGTTLRLRQPTRESGLDACPAIRVIGIAFGQPPQAMQVFGQYDDSDHMERPCALRVAEGGPQQIDALDQ